MDKWYSSCIIHIDTREDNIIVLVSSKPRNRNQKREDRLDSFLFDLRRRRECALVGWKETAIKEHGFPLRGNETSNTVTFTGAHRTGERVSRRASFARDLDTLAGNRRPRTRWIRVDIALRQWSSLKERKREKLADCSRLSPIILKAGAPIDPSPTKFFIHCIIHRWLFFFIAYHSDLVKEKINFPLIILELFRLKEIRAVSIA